MLVVVAALVLLVAYVASVAGRIWWDARGTATGPADAIVVLGAAQLDGRPSSILEARLRQAELLHEQGAAPVVITVGGKLPLDRTTEADAGKAWLESRGMAPDDVVAVPTGSNTQTSLEAVDALMDERGWTSALLVTDPWHTFRSEAMARSLGLEADSAPTRSGPTVQTRETQLRYIVRETGAYLHWRILGRSRADPGTG